MARETSFHYAFVILPRVQRKAIEAVWDFCRAVDDAVDEAAPEGEWPLADAARQRAEAQLQSWRDEVARAFAGDAAGPLRTPQGRALQPVVTQFGLTRQPFDDLIDGVAMDLDRVRYATVAELEEYSRRVASAVGLICIDIFACRDAGAREYAVNLGLALQMTNIVRDVAVDLARGRVYLPQQDLARFHCSEEQLQSGTVTPPVRELLAFEITRARQYFARAAAALPPSESRRLVAAEIMGAIYRDLLRRIEANGYDVFTSPIRVPRSVRIRIAFTTWLRTIAGMRRSTSFAEERVS